VDELDSLTLMDDVVENAPLVDEVENA